MHLFLFSFQSFTENHDINVYNCSIYSHLVVFSILELENSKVFIFCDNTCNQAVEICYNIVKTRDAPIPILVSVSGPILSSCTRTRTHKSTPIPKTDTP